MAAIKHQRILKHLHARKCTDFGWYKRPLDIRTHRVLIKERKQVIKYLDDGMVGSCDRNSTNKINEKIYWTKWVSGRSCLWSRLDIESAALGAWMLDFLRCSMIVGAATNSRFILNKLWFWWGLCRYQTRALASYYKLAENELNILLENKIENLLSEIY